MQEKKRIPLKRLHRLRNARKQAAETDDLTPMMKAIKAVHSVTSTGSTQPEDLERQRAAQELFGRLVTPNLLINTTPITVNNVSAEWVRMNQGHDRRHVVLYCHGGGYTCGQLGYARVLASKLALSTGCDVLSFEYRLAPEAPYPSAIDDALRVWDYLMYMGIGARDVIVAGDSAGGNLALELALAVKAQGRSQPCALVLMSPWTDMTMQGASYQKCAALDPMLTHDYIDSCRIDWRCKLPNDADMDLAPAEILSNKNAIFVPSSVGKIYAVASDGSHVIWARKLSNTVINHILPLSEDTVVASTMDGIVVCIKYTR